MFRKLAALQERFEKVNFMAAFKKMHSSKKFWFTEAFWHGFCKELLFKISENVLQSMAVISFIQEVVTLLKLTCVEYIVYRTLKAISIV